MRRTIGNFFLVGVGLILGILFAEASGRILFPEWRDFFSGRFMSSTYVPGYGRTTIGRPGFDGYFAQNNGDFRVRIGINGFGLRNAEPIENSDGRVWVVGDSFTFGWGVEQDDIYSSVVARTLGMPTYNVASPGTDVCGYEALIARMPARARPKAVVVGLTLENDISLYDCQKNAQKQQAGKNAYPGDEAFPSRPSVAGLKGLLTNHSALYNVTVAAMKRVRVINEWLVQLGLVAREHVDSTAISADAIGAIAASTAKELFRLRGLLAPGTPFSVLLIPARFEIRDGAPVHRQLRRAVIEELTKRGLAFIDPFEEFKRAGFGPTHFAHDGHWSALGHKIAAQAAADWLRRQDVGN